MEKMFIWSNFGQNPSAMGVMTFARIKHLIWYQLLASKAEIIQRKKLKLSLSARQKPICKFVLKGQGIFSLDVNKILRLQVKLNSRYAKNVMILLIC